jgi:hypothetical protein
MIRFFIKSALPHIICYEYYIIFSDWHCKPLHPLPYLVEIASV